jgi:hypothetical protein
VLGDGDFLATPLSEGEVTDLEIRRRGSGLGGHEDEKLKEADG